MVMSGGGAVGIKGMHGCEDGGDGGDGRDGGRRRQARIDIERRREKASMTIAFLSFVFRVSSRRSSSLCSCRLSCIVFSLLFPRYISFCLLSPSCPCTRSRSLPRLSFFLPPLSSFLQPLSFFLHPRPSSLVFLPDVVFILIDVIFILIVWLCSSMTACMLACIHVSHLSIQMY
eukprot:m.224209 g.224209  ORF g.224209 m.224209 type:complete len:174 (-) comp17030_c7_seq7:99-620(-)